MTELRDQSVQPVPGRPSLVAKMQPFIPGGQLRDQALHAVRRSVYLAHIPDLAFPACVRDRYGIRSLRNVDPNIPFRDDRHDPSSTR